MQELEGVGARHFAVGNHRTNGRADADDRTNPRIRAGCAQSDRCTERESSEHQGQMVLGVKPVESGANIVDFAVALVVLTLAQSGSTEVEAQDGKAKAVQRLHGVKDDLVVERPAEERMGMTDHRRVRGVLCSGVEQGLQASSRAVEEE